MEQHVDVLLASVEVLLAVSALQSMFTGHVTLQGLRL
jgi:hypothetical protein